MIVNQSALSGIYNSFSTVFNKTLEGVEPVHSPFVMDVPTTGKQVDYKWLGNFPLMREWIGERVVKQLSAHDYSIKNKSFEATIEVDRDDIEDDQIGVYLPAVQGLAHAAKIHPGQLVFALLKAGFSTTCYDGQYFFDTDHPVGGTSVSNSGGGSGTAWYLMDLSRPIKPIILQTRKTPQFVSLDAPTSENAFMRRKYLYGVEDRKNVGFALWQTAYASKQTLDATSFAAARVAMMEFTNDEGEPLGIMPTDMLVPPSLESAAKDLLELAFKTGGESNKWLNSVKLHVIPWLK